MTVVGLSLLPLWGCSTPPVVTTTANHTASMMGQLQAETSRFKQATVVSDESVLATAKGLQGRVAQQRSSLNSQLRAEEAAGNIETVQLLGRLKALADGLKQDDVELDALSAKTDAEMAALLKPLPNAPARLATAAGAVAAIGKDLSSETQVKETVTLLQGVFKSAKEDHDKLKKTTP